MDVRYLPILFVIISRLPGGSSQTGQRCKGSNECRQKDNYYCDINSRRCGCLPQHTEWNGKCQKKAQVGYGQSCGGLVTCNPPFVCPTQGGKCECPDPAHGFDGQMCVPRKPHGATCGYDDCLLNVGLNCFSGTCSCSGSNIWRVTKCAPRSAFGGLCSSDQECLQQENLQCTHGVCVCSGTNLAPQPNGGCGPKALLLQRCDPLPQCEDAPGFNLECFGVCLCATGFVEVPGSKCDVPAKLGQKCPLPVCDPKGFMDCTKNNCTCKPDNFEQPNGVCGPPAIHGGACNLPICRYNSNLQCDPISKTCICNKPDLVPLDDGSCGAKGKLGERCGRPVCESGPNWNLECSPSKKCVCIDNHFEVPGQRCAPPAKLGEKCPKLPCDPKGAMDCTNNICVCKPGNVEYPLRICGLPALHKQPCDPPICKTNSNLVCSSLTKKCECSDRWMDGNKSGGCDVRLLSVWNKFCEYDYDCVPGYFLECKAGKCDCLKYYNVLHPAKVLCERTPSRYEGFCQVNAHCLENHKLICDLQTKTCDCAGGHDLDKLGETPCVFKRLGGRSYGESCEETRPIRRCVVAHNLECIQGTCVCIQNHIPDKSTEKDPAIGVITCKLASGTQGRGDPCAPNSNDITQKCDDLLDIGCDPVHKVCVCVPGFIPTVGKPHPCDGGQQKFDAGCDPPEIIIPPRGIDPITRLPLPGPTSPPPPKFACDPALNLTCVKGKCRCQDEGFSKRYRLDPKSGKCLITPGYACKADKDCFSNKCVTKAEAGISTGGHSHDEKICDGPRKSGAISRVSDSTTFLQVLLIGQLVNFP